MTETVTIDLGDGSTVTAEVIGDLPFQQPAEAAAGGGYGDVGFGDGRRAAQLGSAVALTLDQVRSTVQGVGRWAAESIAQGAAGSPDQFEVEFGLKLAVKSGQLFGIIAEAGSEAGLTVKLSWDLAARRERAATAAAAEPTAEPVPAPGTGPDPAAGPTSAGTGSPE